jgi:PAS domain S-box-containing protein
MTLGASVSTPAADRDDRKLRRERYAGVWNILASLFITALTITAMETCSRFVAPVPSPSPVLLLAVCSAAFLGGLPAGVLSAAMCMLYGAYCFAEPGPPLRYTQDHTMRLITLSAAAPAMALLVGALRRRSETAAREISRQQSERRFLMSFDRAAVGMATVSLGGRWMRVNPKLCELLGYECGALLDKSWQETIVTEDTPPIDAQVQQLISGAIDSFQVEARQIRGSDKRIIWTQQTVTLIRDEENRPDHLVLVVSDISDRKSADEARRRAEGAVRRSERQLRQAVIEAPIPMIMHTEDGQIIQVSSAWTELSGYAPSDIPDFQTWLTKAHAQDAAHVDRSIRQLFDAAEGAGFRDREFIVSTKSGEKRIWSFSSSSPGVLEDGRRYMVTMARDVTLRRRAEAALAQSEHRYRSLVSATAQVVWTTSANGDIVDELPTWQEFTGQTYEQYKGQAWLNAVHPEDRQRVSESWRRALRSNSVFEEEFRVRAAADGSWREMLSRGVPVLDVTGRVREWVGTLRDVTERRQAVEQLRRAKDAAEAANHAKDQFLAALSHELRTPLTPVLLSAAALGEDDSLPPSVREDLAIIRRNVDLEARLIDDLLDLTRVARGKLQLDLRPVDVSVCLEAAIDVCCDDARSKGISINVKLPGTPEHLYVRADAARLQQVLWNLLKNAVKFTPVGGTISVVCDTSHTDVVRLDVIDTGIGIAPDALPKIFDAFEQGNTSISKQFGGLGLGLAISKALVDMHGGKLSATSEGVGKGATFTVELPTIPVPQDMHTEIVVPARRDRSDAWRARRLPAVASKPLSILLVEDHDATSRVLSMLLRRLNHRVTTAADLASARQCAQQQQFDLLISDIGLPDGSGLDLMRELREKYKDQLKGICLSGYGMDQDVIQSRAAGFAFHLTKPVDFPKLKATIESVA